MGTYKNKKKKSWRGTHPFRFHFLFIALTSDEGKNPKLQALTSLLHSFSFNRQGTRKFSVNKRAYSPKKLTKFTAFSVFIVGFFLFFVKFLDAHI